MKWAKKYDVDVQKIHELNIGGSSLPDISKMFGIPQTTLNRYLKNAGFKVQTNGHSTAIRGWISRARKSEFTCSTAWKNALIRRFGHRCMVEGCEYETIVEAAHIIAQVDGGKMTLDNGVVVCPNHHAESHAGLVDFKKVASVWLSKHGQASMIQSKLDDNWEDISQTKIVGRVKQTGRRKIIDERMSEVSRLEVEQQDCSLIERNELKWQK